MANANDDATDGGRCYAWVAGIPTMSAPDRSYVARKLVSPGDVRVGPQILRDARDGDGNAAFLLYWNGRPDDLRRDATDDLRGDVRILATGVGTFPDLPDGWSESRRGAR